MSTSRVVTELRAAARSLFRSPLFGGTAVVVLGIGVGAVTAIFTVVSGVLLDPLPLPDSDELVIVCERHPSIAELCIGSPPTTDDLARRASTLESVGLARRWTFDVDDGDRELQLPTGIATPGFFDVLRARTVAGRLFAEDEVGEDANVALLGHATWTGSFGADPDVVGRTLLLDGTPHLVVGVLAPEVDVPTLRGVQLWRPLHFDPRAEERRSWRGFQVLARRAGGSDLAAVSAELDAIYEALRRETEAVTDEWRLEVLPYRSWVTHDVRGTLLVFLGAVGLLLLIACANVANLLLVRSARRSRDLALRAALGADRGDLVAGVLAESALLALGGGLLGLVLAGVGRSAFVAMAPPGIPRIDNVALDAPVFAFALGVSLLTLLLFGLVPALRTAQGDLADGLRGASAGVVDAGSRTRRGLVVAEIALSVVLLSSAGLLARSFVRHLAWDPGFDRGGLAAASVYFPPQVVGDLPVPEWLERSEEVARAVPGVTHAAFASAIPLLGGRETVEFRPGDRAPAGAEELPRARVYDVSPGYFEALGVPLVDGRPFRETDVAAAEPVLLVNEAFTRRYDLGVGDRLTVPAGNWADEDVAYRIVGVVEDVPPLTPGESTEPEVYRTNRQYARIFPYLVLRARDDPVAVAARVRDRLLAEVDPGLTVNVEGTMDALVDRRLVRPRFDTALLGAFAGAALLLTLAGVYGVLAFSVVQRRREMGLRMALGSDRRGVLSRVVAEGLRLTVPGLLLGLAGSVVAAGVVARAVRGVEAADVATLGGTALAVTLLAAAASLVPAVRASRVDPVTLLKEQ